MMQQSYVIRTVTGQYVDLAKPSPAAVRLEDMGHALAGIIRFQGHTIYPITVLEHLLNTYDRALQLTDDRMVAFAALMHDAHEVYVCDVPTPLKRLLGETYRVIEDGWQEAVFKWAGIPFELAEHPIVKQADREMLLIEAREYHGATQEELEEYWPPGTILPGKLHNWHAFEPAYDGGLGDLAGASRHWMRMVGTHVELNLMSAPVDECPSHA